MAMDMKVAILIGNVSNTHGIQTRGANNTIILNFSIGCNTKRKGQDGQYIDEVSYFDFVMFGQYAEKISQYIQKGKKVCIKAEPRQNRWQDKETKKTRSKIEFVVESVQFLDSQKQNNNEYGNNNGYTNNNYNNQNNNSFQNNNNQNNNNQNGNTQQNQYDDDIPF